MTTVRTGMRPPSAATNWWAGLMVDALHQAPDSGDRRAALVHFVERVGAEDAGPPRRALDGLEAKTAEPGRR